MAPGMIRPKALPELLNQAKRNGVKTSLLFDGKGALLASAGDKMDEQLKSAIISSIWTTYDTIGKEAFNAQSLNCMFLDFEASKVIVMPINAGLTLAVIAESRSEVGLLKMKAQALKQYLDECFGALLTQS